MHAMDVIRMNPNILSHRPDGSHFFDITHHVCCQKRICVAASCQLAGSVLIPCKTSEVFRNFGSLNGQTGTLPGCASTSWQDAERDILGRNCPFLQVSSPYVKETIDERLNTTSNACERIAYCSGIPGSGTTRFSQQPNQVPSSTTHHSWTTAPLVRLLRQTSVRYHESVCVGNGSRFRTSVTKSRRRDKNRDGGSAGQRSLDRVGEKLGLVLATGLHVTVASRFNNENTLE